MSDDFDSDEIARRRDEVIRRMANTPPRPKNRRPSKKKTKAGVGRAAHKGRGRRGVQTET